MSARDRAQEELMRRVGKNRAPTSSTARDPEEHEHRWQNGAVLHRSREAASPCSRLDDHLWDDIIQVQSCECGAVRKLLLGFTNQRRRGDDIRRAEGRAPLGTPLPRSGTYGTPKLVR